MLRYKTKVSANFGLIRRFGTEELKKLVVKATSACYLSNIVYYFSCRRIHFVSAAEAGANLLNTIWRVIANVNYENNHEVQPR